MSLDAYGTSVDAWPHPPNEGLGARVPAACLTAGRVPDDPPPAMEPTASSGRAFGFEPVEHTADVGVRAWGRTLEELFTQAGLGMVSLLVDPASVRSAARRTVRLEAHDLEECLIAWLQEILYLYEVGRFVPAGVAVTQVTPESVTAEVIGEPLDRSRHESRADIKAATYHDLRIRTIRDAGGGDRYETVVIFDI